MKPAALLRRMALDRHLIAAPEISFLDLAGARRETLRARPDRDDAYAPLFVIEPSAPKAARTAVECLGRMFRREFGYDFAPYSADYCDAQRAVAWVSLDEDRYRAIGAAGFVRRQYRSLPESVTELAWVWLHPFYRRRGVLSASWPALLAEFGPFGVHGPLSPAMAAFLADKPHRDMFTTDDPPHAYPVFVGDDHEGAAP